MSRQSLLALASQGVILLSLVVLAVTAALALRLIGAGRSLSWLEPAYLTAQCLFALLIWLGVQCNSLESRAYLICFGVGFVLVLGFALAFAIRLAFVHPKALGVWLICTAFSFAACLCVIVYLELRKIYGIHPIPPQCQMAMLQGGVLLFCGATSLVALFTELAPELRHAVIAFGVFWMLLGLLALGYSLGIIRNRQVWIHLNDFLPAFLAIVAFSWLAIQWGGLQAELSRESIHPRMRVESSPAGLHAMQCTVDGSTWWPARKDGICYAVDEPRRAVQ
jgi:hypothetical protein